MKKLHPEREKALKNAEFASRYPKHTRRQRRKLRKKRTIARELAWLSAVGIPRDPEHPLV